MAQASIANNAKITFQDYNDSMPAQYEEEDKNESTSHSILQYPYRNIQLDSK